MSIIERCFAYSFRSLSHSLSFLVQIINFATRNSIWMRVLAFKIILITYIWFWFRFVLPVLFSKKKSSLICCWCILFSVSHVIILTEPQRNSHLELLFFFWVLFVFFFQFASISILRVTCYTIILPLNDMPSLSKSACKFAKWSIHSACVCRLCSFFLFVTILYLFYWQVWISREFQNMTFIAVIYA